MSAEYPIPIIEVEFAGQPCIEIYGDGTGGGPGYRKPERMISETELMCSAHVYPSHLRMLRA